MATKLSIYNAALTKHLGERKLASLSESREPRRVLDDIWDDDFVGACLELGQWNFASRTAEIDYSDSVTPPFGYIHAFEKPDDWRRTIALSSDPYFNEPLIRVTDEANYWFSDADILYVKYVSDDAEYGNDLSLWPATFTHWTEAHLANLACERITQSSTKQEKLEARDRKLLRKAQGIDAMNDPVTFPPQGAWVGSRFGRNSRSRER